MGWFKRLKDGIQTATKNKKEAPDGLWNKCKGCAEMTTMKVTSRPTKTDSLWPTRNLVK